MSDERNELKLPKYVLYDSELGEILCASNSLAVIDKHVSEICLAEEVVKVKMTVLHELAKRTEAADARDRELDERQHIIDKQILELSTKAER